MLITTLIKPPFEAHQRFPLDRFLLKGLSHRNYPTRQTRLCGTNLVIIPHLTLKPLAIFSVFKNGLVKSAGNIEYWLLVVWLGSDQGSQINLDHVRESVIFCCVCKKQSWRRQSCVIRRLFASLRDRIFLFKSPFNFHGAWEQDLPRKKVSVWQILLILAQ